MENPLPVSDMEVLKKAALAYYARAPEDGRQSARDIFGELDSDKNGKIDIHEFLKTQDKGEDKMQFARIFLNLDTNGNGTLDFQEFLVLFFLYMSEGVPSCDECKNMLVNIYFSCLECHLKSSVDSFDICTDCYHYKKFSHSHSLFLDNHTLLRFYKTKVAAPLQAQASSYGVRKVETTRSQSRTEKMERRLKYLNISNGAAKTGLEIVQQCTTM